MKALELTKEHKSKLLEMCKDLFPKYKVKFIPDNLLEYDDQIFNYLSIEEITEKEVDFTVIHWFEFCMTHLANKIYYPDLNNIARGARNKIQSFFFSTFMEAIEGGTAGYDHPIDYLYSDFKKITVKQSKERFCHECNSWGNGCGQCV